MSTHARGQLARIVRLVLLVLISLAGTAPLHDIIIRYPVAATGVALLEALWREVAPTIPLERVESYTDHKDDKPSPSGW